MRICIVAEHASFRFGGEAVLPLHYFTRLRARGVEVWLVVHARARAELETLLPREKERMRFVEDAWYHRLLFRLSYVLPHRLSDSTVRMLSQLITQSLARKSVRELIRLESVDLVHQPIPVSPRFPSLMTGLGVPVIIGPMNGGMEYPPAFRHTESAISRMTVAIGRRLSNLVHLLLRGKKDAVILLVANQRTHSALPACARGRVIEIPENGVDLALWSQTDPIRAGSLTEPAEQQSPRFVFMGRLVDWKGVDMAIDALAQVPGAHLEIIGEGGMRERWRSHAARLGLDSRVHFSGWLTQEECSKRLRTAVALVLPSIYESGGAVVLEAMATGTPVIALRWGGPADYLDTSCGILIEPSSRGAVVQGMAEAMRTLIAAPSLAYRMGARGRERVQANFDWERKLDRIIEIYQEVLADASNFHDARFPIAERSR